MISTSITNATARFQLATRTGFAIFAINSVFGFCFKNVSVEWLSPANWQGLLAPSQVSENHIFAWRRLRRAPSAFLKTF